MKKSRMEAKAKTFLQRSERQKQLADRFYAAYKSTKDQNDYKQSQYYYKCFKESLEILNETLEQIRKGLFDD